MKKTHRKKLRLERDTIRALQDYEATIPRGGLMNVSVATCTGCFDTYCFGCKETVNASCPISCRPTEQVGCP